MPIFWQGTPYLLYSWPLCDIAVDDPCCVSDVLTPMNHTELLHINLADICLQFFLFSPDCRCRDLWNYQFLLVCFITKEKQGVTGRMNIRRIMWCLDFVSCVAFHRLKRIFGEVDVFMSSWVRSWEGISSVLSVTDVCLQSLDWLLWTLTMYPHIVSFPVAQTYPGKCYWCHILVL